jgi:hypothetical protein
VRIAIANESTQPMSDHPNNRLIAKTDPTFYNSSHYPYPSQPHVEEHGRDSDCANQNTSAPPLVPITA